MRSNDFEPCEMVQNMWISLYLCPMPVVAAINGIGYAAACLLSLACDYRILADNPKFVQGLNETQAPDY